MIPSVRFGGFALAFFSCTTLHTLALAKVGMGPGGINANQLDAASADCESVCSNLLFGDERKGAANEWNPTTADSQFKIRWSKADDQWCADHGSPTDEAVPAQKVAPSPSPPFTPEQCPYPIFQGETCDNVKKKLMRCKLKNSQIESQCVAYFQAKDGINWQWTLVVIDAAAAASCLGACYLGDQMNPALSTACTAAGVAATGTEAFAALKMKNSTFMKIIGGAAAAGGGAMVARKAMTSEPAKDPNQKPGANEEKSDKRQSACLAGYFFTALAGIRGYSIYDATQTEENACKSIQDLGSKAAVIGGGPGQIAQPDVTFQNGMGTATGNGTGNTTGGNTSTLTAPSTQTTLDTTTGKLIGQAAMAGDGSILNRTDLTKQVLPKARQINPNELMSSIGQDPGRAVGQSIMAMGNGLLPPSALKGVDSVIGDIRNNRKGYARDILGSGNVGTYQSGGGSAGGSAPASDGTGEITAALSGLFGGMQPDSGPKTPSSQEISFPGQDSGDIWHSQARQTSIFDIVSSRIHKATYRME